MKKNFRTIASLFTTAVLLAGSLTACGVQGSIAENNNAADTNAATETAKVDSVSVETVASPETTASSEKKDFGTLNVSFPTGNIRVTVDILALEKGYFEEEGVEIVPIAIIGNDALTAINEDGGQLDILTAGFVGDVQAIGAGYDLKFVGGTAVEGGAVIAKKGNADKYKATDTLINFDEVTTAKIGFKRNEAAWIVTRQYLLDNGVDASVIEAIENEDTGNVSYYGDDTATAQAVQKGEIELGFLPMEFALLYADAYDLEVVAAAGDLSPNYVCCREVTSSKRYTEKYDSFVAYETARIRAFEYYKQGETDDAVKADVVNTVANYSGKEADYVETYLYGGVTKFAVDPNTTGIENYVEAAYNSGVFASSAVDFGSYDIQKNVDTSAYKQALDNLVDANPENAFYASLLDEYEAAN